LESDDVSELNDSMNVQQSSDSCAVHEMQQVFNAWYLLFNSSWCSCLRICSILWFACDIRRYI